MKFPYFNVLLFVVFKCYNLDDFLNKLSFLNKFVIKKNEKMGGILINPINMCLSMISVFPLSLM